jgi:hypothetical protein
MIKKEFSMLADLSRKNINAKNMVKKILKDKELISELLEGILSKKERIRFNSFKVLLLLSEEHPKVLYTHWDFFADLLKSGNTYLKYIAVLIIANLTKDDPRGRFKRIFNRYYALLDDKSVIPAAHVAASSGKIVRAIPKLQTKITNKLLQIDQTAHHPERKDLIKGHAIESFGEYFEEVKNKKKIILFVREQLNSRSPRTKKVAKEFLKRVEQ